MGLEYCSTRAFGQSSMMSSTMLSNTARCRSPRKMHRAQGVADALTDAILGGNGDVRPSRLKTAYGDGYDHIIGPL